MGLLILIPAPSRRDFKQREPRVLHLGSINNVAVNIDGDVLIGNSDHAYISDSSISCKRFIIKANHLTVNAFSPSITSIYCEEGIQSLYDNPFMVTTNSSGIIKVNIPSSLVQIRANKLGIFIASAKKVYRFSKPISHKRSAVNGFCSIFFQRSIHYAPGLSASCLAFAFEGEAVCYHGDEFTISNAKNRYFCLISHKIEQSSLWLRQPWPAVSPWSWRTSG